MKTLARVAVGVVTTKAMTSPLRKGRTWRPAGSGKLLDALVACGDGGMGSVMDVFRDKESTTPLATVASDAGMAGPFPGLGGAGAVRSVTSDQVPQTQRDIAASPNLDPAAEQERLAAVMLLAIVQAARSDGDLAPEERTRIMDQLSDVSPAERAFVEMAMTRDMSVVDLAAMVPQDAKAQVYAMALMVIDLDRQDETDFLLALADQMDLRSVTVNAIHGQMGAAPLYG